MNEHRPLDDALGSQVECMELGGSASSTPATHLRLTWVGFELHSCRFIDRQPLPISAPRRMVALYEWWKKSIPWWKRLFMFAMFCKRPMVAIGTLSAVSLALSVEHAVSHWYKELPETRFEQTCPHETQFHSLERSEMLTRGSVHTRCVTKPIISYRIRILMWTQNEGSLRSRTDKFSSWVWRRVRSFWQFP